MRIRKLENVRWLNDVPLLGPPKRLGQYMALLAWSILVAPVCANAITINNVSDSPSHFRAVVNSSTGVGAIDWTWQLNDLPGTPWESNSTIFEDSGLTFDALTISWGIKHLLGPHANDVNPHPVTTTLMVQFTAPGSAGLFYVEDKKMIEHPLTTGGSHTDIFTLSLSGTMTASRDITSYLVVYDAVHVVPEPATALLLCLGLVGLVFGRKKLLRAERER